MGVLKRNRRHVRVSVAAGSVASVIMTIRQRSGQAIDPVGWRRYVVNDPLQLRLHVGDDGTFRAALVPARRSPPLLRGHLAVGDGRVVLEGDVRESWIEAAYRRLFVVLAVPFVAGAIALALGGKPIPGAGCGVVVIILVLIAYLLSRVERTLFERDCQQLMAEVTRRVVPDSESAKSFEGFEETDKRIQPG